MIGETTLEVTAAAVRSDVTRHDRFSVFQAGFWRDVTFIGVVGERREELVRSLRPAVSLMAPSTP